MTNYPLHLTIHGGIPAFTYRSTADGPDHLKAACTILWFICGEKRMAVVP